MMVIWKKALEVVSIQTIELPEGAEIINVENQYDKICLWVIVDPNKPTENRTIQIVGTGHTIDPRGKFLGTVIIDRYVWHLFEILGQ